MAQTVVGPWAEDKLDRLRKYLSAYTTMMKGQSSWCEGYHYIDAFAWPGEHQLRDENEGTSHDARQVLLDVANFGQETGGAEAIPRRFTPRCSGSSAPVHDVRLRRTVAESRCGTGRTQDRVRSLVKWYRERLRQAFGHASRAALIRNTRQGHLYYLILVSANKTGVKIADDILSAGETV